MGKYLKFFVFASLIYLGLAALLGILNGTVDTGYWGSFAHTHFNLLGFMSMMIFGIGYFILPRFNGAELRFPSWVPIHFWVGNISLVGMVLFRALTVEQGSEIASTLFIISAAAQATTIIMFIVNIWMTLAGPADTLKASETADSQPEDIELSKSIAVTPDSRIADLVDALPSVQDVLVTNGLRSLGNPGHLDKVREMGITVGMACANHGLEQDQIILLIEKELRQAGLSIGTDLDQAVQSAPAPKISSNALIGDIMSNYPASRPLFQKHFGAGCFDCPGQAYESVEMACQVHGIDSRAFLQSLNKVLSGS